MLKKKLPLLIIAIILVIAAIIVAILRQVQETPKSTREKITLNEVAHSIFYAPMYVAINEGYFADEGIDIELVTGFGADKTMTALISGEADVAFCGSESSIYAYLQGAKDYAVNFAGLTQRAGNFLVAREAMPNFDWSMLKDKEVIGGRNGGMPEMILEYILKQNGIDPSKDLTIIKNIDFGLTSGAFSGGTGDFTVEFEPNATALENEGAGFVVASLGVDSGYVPYTAFCAKKSFIEEHPDTIRKFIKAINKGLTFVATHSDEEIAAIIAPTFPDMDEANIAKIVNRYRLQDTWKETSFFTEESFNLLCDILYDAGEIDEYPEFESLVDNRFQ